MIKLYYFDLNRRVYEMGGIKKNAPYYIGHFIPIKVVEETPKEFVCEYGAVNKKTGMYKVGSTKFKTYTEQEMLDEVYVNENRHIIADKIRKASADVLRQIENVLEANKI